MIARLSGSPEVRLFLAMVHYHNLIYWRSPAATFFTIILPLILLVMLQTVLGGLPIFLTGTTLAEFYTTSLAAYSVVSVCYMYLGILTAAQRTSGALKRFHGMPVPGLLFVAAKMTSTTLIAILAMALLLAVGDFLYGAVVGPDAVPLLALILPFGIFCFCGLGVFAGTLARNIETAQALTNATLLPLAFISGIFLYPMGNTPDWLETIASCFPLQHFARAVAAALRSDGSGIAWDQLTLALSVLMVWGVAGVIGIAVLRHVDAARLAA